MPTDHWPAVGFNEARDDGVAVASAGPYANHICTSLQTDNQHLIAQFLQAGMLFPMPN